jgi:AcrR family transcriptional regulator
LLRFGRTELARSGTVRFNLDAVLRRSRVARSSLYHHFDSREGFVAALEFERLCGEILGEMELLRTVVMQVEDLDAVLGVVETTLRALGRENGRDRRRLRVESLAASFASPALRRAVREAQVRGTDHFLETLRLWADARGVRYRTPTEGIAYAVQSLLLGRVLVDLVEDSDLDTVYVTTTIGALRHLLQVEPSRGTA